MFLQQPASSHRHSNRSYLEYHTYYATVAAACKSLLSRYGIGRDCGVQHSYTRLSMVFNNVHLVSDSVNALLDVLQLWRDNDAGHTEDDSRLQKGHLLRVCRDVNAKG